MDSVNVRNLDQIQESDPRGRSSRAASLLLAGLGGGAVLLGASLAMKQAEPPRESRVDPLAQLVARSKQAPVDPPQTVRQSDVTFPSILSDSDRPTTALAAVKDERGKLVSPEPSAATVAPPVPAADQLPASPLPVGTLLNATAVTQEPRDSLTALAADVSKPGTGTVVTAGSDGGFQLQIASFKDQGDADQLVEQLRLRGHAAYRQAAYVSDRGLWHRVRVGPFTTKLAAEKYKAEFDKKERMSSFLVDPDKVKRQEELRAGKLAARARVEDQ